MGEPGLPAADRQTHPVGHFGVSLVTGALSICDALIDLNRHHAMEEEFSTLITNNACDLVPCLVGSNVISGKWIFKHKFNSGGSLEQYKARWVLYGFTQ
jgi:hypothetical protein